MNTNSKTLIIEQPKPIRKQVYEHLQEQILNHTSEPASRLVEAQIAKSLGTSRTPVREALHLLEKDGFIESIPRVGYRIKRLAIEELDEILEIRKVNEMLACRWALKRIDKKSLASLEKNITATRRMLGNGNPSSFIQFDEEFHDILVRSAGSKHLQEMCQQLRRLMYRYRSESLKTMMSVQSAFEGHEMILEKLKDKDETGLEKALIDHLNYSRNDIREIARLQETNGEKFY